MNIFEYFEASGKAFWIDEQRKSVWFSRPDGTVIERPWDGSYTRTLNRSFYDRHTYQAIKISYDDRQFIDSMEFSISKIIAFYGVPRGLLSAYASAQIR